MFDGLDRIAGALESFARNAYHYTTDRRAVIATGLALAGCGSLSLNPTSPEPPFYFGRENGKPFLGYRIGTQEFKLYGDATLQERIDFILTYSAPLTDRLLANKPTASGYLPDLRPEEIKWMPRLSHDYGVLDGEVNFEDFFAFALAFGLKEGDEGYNQIFNTQKIGASAKRIDIGDVEELQRSWLKTQKVMSPYVIYQSSGGQLGYNLLYVSIPYKSGLEPSWGIGLLGADPIQNMSREVRDEHLILTFDISQYHGKDLIVRAFQLDKDGEYVEGAQRLVHVK